VRGAGFERTQGWQVTLEANFAEAQPADLVRIPPEATKNAGNGLHSAITCTCFGAPGRIRTRRDKLNINFMVLGGVQ